MLPVAGVAVAYGREVDPTYDIGLAAPYSTFRLLLLRSSAVLVTTLVLIAASAVLLPFDGWLAAAWLLPSLALSAATLAVSTRIDPVWSGGSIVAAWVLTVLSTIRVTGSALAAFGPATQVICTVLLAVSVAVLVHRGCTPAADLRENS